MYYAPNQAPALSSLSAQAAPSRSVSKTAPGPSFNLAQIKDPGFVERTDFDQPSDVTDTSEGMSIEIEALQTQVAQSYRQGRINGFFWGLGVGALAAYLLARAL